MRELFDIYKYPIKEMAFSQNQAIDKCLELGKKFVDHFNKIMVEGKNSNNFQHHCQEMQAWWDKVRKIKLKSTNDYITNSKLSDWFFTVGQGTEDIILPNYISTYEKFYVMLLVDHDKLVKNCFEEIMR